MMSQETMVDDKEEKLEMEQESMSMSEQGDFHMSEKEVKSEKKEPKEPTRIESELLFCAWVGGS